MKGVQCYELFEGIALRNDAFLKVKVVRGDIVIRLIVELLCNVE